MFYEFDRDKFYQISLLDFKKNIVSRIYHKEKTPIKRIVDDFKYGNFKTFEKVGKVSSFPIEKIKKPFFSFWSSPKLLFDE